MFAVCNNLTKVDILSATKSLPLDWDAVENFVRNNQIQYLRGRIASINRRLNGTDIS